MELEKIWIFCFFGITVANNVSYTEIKRHGAAGFGSPIEPKKRERWQIVGTLFDGSNGVTSLI